MNNIKIAKELIKLAKELIAEQTVSLVLNDETGNVQEINNSLFNKIFSSQRIASENDEEKIKTKSVFYVSPCVNATNQPRAGFIGFFDKLENSVKTILNKLNYRKKIFDVMFDSEDKDRTKTKQKQYHLGCTITKGHGVYPSPSNKIFIENTYIITIYGATVQQTNKIADGLRIAFDQQSVLVQFNDEIISNYNPWEMIEDKTK